MHHHTGVRIFEAGFGTGLNAWLTLLESQKRKKQTIYHAIEFFPLPPEIIQELNFEKFDNGNNLPGLFSLHQVEWDQDVQLTDYFTLRKIKADLTTYLPEKEYYHTIYFDAFAPDKQPELWTAGVFGNMHECLQNGGVMVTYSCKGSVRRLLQETGFKVTKLPGPPGGKREMLKAEKI